MPTLDYTTARSQLTALGNTITANVDRLRNSKAQATTADNSLGGLSASSATLRTFIDDQATANPSDDLWLDLKAEKDEMVTNFLARKTTSAAMVTALAPHDP